MSSFSHSEWRLRRLLFFHFLLPINLILLPHSHRHLEMRLHTCLLWLRGREVLTQNEEVEGERVVYGGRRRMEIDKSQQRGRAPRLRNLKGRRTGLAAEAAEGDRPPEGGMRRRKRGGGSSPWRDTAKMAKEDSPAIPKLRAVLVCYFTYVVDTYRHNTVCSSSCQIFRLFGLLLAWGKKEKECHIKVQSTEKKESGFQIRLRRVPSLPMHITPCTLPKKLRKAQNRN